MTADDIDKLWEIISRLADHASGEEELEPAVAGRMAAWLNGFTNRKALGETPRKEGSEP